MPRLVPCPVCACHVVRTERRCPHCGASLAVERIKPTSAALVLGLTAVAIPPIAGSCSDTDEDDDYTTATSTTKYALTTIVSASTAGNTGGSNDPGGAAGTDGSGATGGAGGNG